MDVVSSLSHKYYCISVDLPGHGKTDNLREETDYTMEICASGIVEILHHLKIQICNLVGYSMGGRLSLYLVSHYPNRFLKVILESTSPGLKSAVAREQRLQNDLKLAKDLEENDLRAFIKAWYQQPIFNSIRKHNAFGQLLKRRLANNSEQLTYALRGMSTGRQKSLWNNLNKIKLPILLITGEFDHKFTAIMQEMVQLLPQADLNIVEGCGHNVHFENSKRYITIVKRFLT
jgi:2-succinyl-6-hydroxy-2,4-cyclohexadiene-1-carboxylate synthase